MNTPNTEEAVFTDERPGLFDPAENFMEATHLHRGYSELEVPGIRRLAEDPDLIRATARSTKQYFRRKPYQLPAVHHPRGPDTNLGDLLSIRRTSLAFESSAPLTVEEVSWLCWAADGVTGSLGGDHLGRTAPSAGGLFPRDLYISIPGTDRLDSGTYHYNPFTHSLEMVNTATPAELIGTSSQTQTLNRATSVFVLCAPYWRSRIKYGQRAIRFTLMELGHVAQNLLLAATALRRDSVPIGGFFDDELCEVMGLDGLHEAPIYMIAIGQKHWGQQNAQRAENGQ